MKKSTTRAAILALALAFSTSVALAANQCFSGASGSVWDATTTSDWGAASGGPYNALWTSGNTAIFEGTAGIVTVSGTDIPTVGGITYSNASGAYVLNGGTLIGANPTIIKQSLASIGFTLNSVIADNGGTPASVNFYNGSSTRGVITNGGLNTYTGPTTNQNTLVSINTIALGGTASSFGAGANTVPVVICTGASYATVYYTGTGGNTDRPWLFSGTGGGIIYNNGTGPISFSNTRNAMIGIVGGRGLTLEGSYTGSANTFAETINDLGTGANISSLKVNQNTWILGGANTYSGSTAISGYGGVLIGSLNSVNGGTPLLASSSLGCPTTVANGTIQIGGTFYYGTLTYTGTGETSDRVINLAGTTGGAIISQSGTGLLKFISALTVTGAGTKTLTLTGSTAGTGEFAGVIVDNQTGTYNTMVTKSGTGTWTLSGANTYTGVTTVSGGTLLVTGSTASGSTVTVQSGGTLGGTGSIAGNVTFNLGACATNNVGAPLAIGGSLTLSNNTFYVATTTNLTVGNYTLLTAAGGITGSFGGVYVSGVGLATNTSASITNNNNTVVLKVTSGALIPVGSLTNWQDWDVAHLALITMTNGTGGFTPTVGFDGPYSLCFQFATNSAITFPYRYNPTSLYYGGWFFTALFDPNATTNDLYTIQFLTNSGVAFTIQLTPTRPYWNRVEVESAMAYGNFQPRTPVGLPIVGYNPSNAPTVYFPSTPTSIRILPPQGRSGNLYIGKLTLAPDATVASLSLQEDDVSSPIYGYGLPATPGSVTPAQSNDLAQVAARLEEVFGVAPYTAVPSNSTDVMNNVEIQYATYGIAWNPVPGIWSGNNFMMYVGAADYNANEDALGNLMYEVAVAYRNTGDTNQQAGLLQMYTNLFNFSECSTGIPDDWAAGQWFMPSIFLMRNFLGTNGYLTPLVLNTYKQRIGFNRIYMTNSWQALTGITGWSPSQSSRDTHRPGELGESLDYMRIISVQLLMDSLLSTNAAQNVRDLTAASSWFSKIAFQYSPGVLDGLKPDGIAFHHWGWDFGYYQDFVVQAPKIIYALAGTSFAIGAVAHQLICNQLVGEDGMSLNSITPGALSGKSGFPYDYGGNSANFPDPYACLALSGSPGATNGIDPVMAGYFQRVYADNTVAGNSGDVMTAFGTKAFALITNAASAAPIGARIYGYEDTATHHGLGWLFTVKGFSKYQYVRESSDPWITYLGYGMLDYYQTNANWSRYGVRKLGTDFGANGYDWRLYPGTTSVDFSNIQAIVDQDYKRYWSDQTFVGGVVQNTNGLFAQSLHGSTNNGLGSFYARKGWFFFNNTVIASGSGISNKIAAAPTVTTLFQDAVSSTQPTYYTNLTPITSLSYSNTATLGTPAWLMDSTNSGYWVPAGSSLTVVRQTQTNPDWGNDTNLTGSFALAWFNHGTAPSGASYWYAQRPQTTPSAMTAFNSGMSSANPPYQLLKLTDKVHAVLSTNEQTYGVIVFDSSSPVGVQDVQDVSLPCTLMVQTPSPVQRTLSVANPDLDEIDNTLYGNNESWGYSQTNPVAVVLNGLWNAIGSPTNVLSVTQNVSSNQTTITLSLSQGLTTSLNLVQTLNVPPGLTAAAVAVNQINLLWNAVTHATGYIVLRGGVPVGFAGSTNYSDAGLLAGTSYTYNVQATNAVAVSESSLPASATTYAPAVPTLKGAGSVSNGMYGFSFSGTNGQCYRVLAATNLMVPISNWMVLTSNLFGAGAVNYFDSVSSNPQRFYRIVSP